MNTVYIKHPRIDGDPVAVPESSLPHHTAAGWVQVEPPAPPVRHRRERPVPEPVVAKRPTRTRRSTATPQED